MFEVIIELIKDERVLANKIADNSDPNLLATELDYRLKLLDKLGGRLHIDR